jgi:hypothetical protein
MKMKGTLVFCFLGGIALAICVLCASCTSMSMSYGVKYNHITGRESRYDSLYGRNNYDYTNNQFLADFSFTWGKYVDTDIGLGLSYIIIDNESNPKFSYTGGYLGLVPAEIGVGLKYPFKIGSFALYPKAATAVNFQLVTGAPEMAFSNDAMLLRGGLGVIYHYSKRGFIKIEGLYNYAIASPGRGLSIICHIGADL